MSLWKAMRKRLMGSGDGIEKKVEWIVPFVRGKRVLDIGFAGERGFDRREIWLHGYLVEAARECVGLDRNEEAIAYGRSRGYQVTAGDAQNFHFDATFDVVTACDVLEHLHDPRGFFQSVNNALTADGMLVLTVPNPWFFHRFARCLLKGNAGVNPDHVCWYCVDTIAEMLDRYGFEIVKLEYGSGEAFYYRLFMLPEILRHSSIFLVARKKPRGTLP